MLYDNKKQQEMPFARPLDLQPTLEETEYLEHALYPELYLPPLDVYNQTRDIADLPLIRSLVLRPSTTIRLLQGNYGMLNYKTALVQQRGTIQPAPCSSCMGLNPKGPYTTCIVLPGSFNGACANCAYDQQETCCTLRRDFQHGRDILEGRAMTEGEVQIDRSSVTKANVGMTTMDRSDNSIAFSPVNTPTPVQATSQMPDLIERQAARVALSPVENIKHRIQVMSEGTLQSPHISPKSQVQAIPFIPEVVPSTAQHSTPKEPVAMRTVKETTQQAQPTNGIPVISRAKPTFPAPVVNGRKECTVCHNMKLLTEYRFTVTQNIPGVPTPRKARCISCEDNKRQKSERASLDTGLPRAASDGKQENELSSQVPTPTSTTSDSTRGSFTAKRGGWMGSAQPRKKKKPKSAEKPIVSDQDLEEEPSIYRSNGNHSKSFTVQEKKGLIEEHEKEAHPTVERRQAIADRFGFELSRVTNWFNNINNPGKQQFYEKWSSNVPTPEAIKDVKPLTEATRPTVHTPASLEEDLEEYNGDSEDYEEEPEEFADDDIDEFDEESDEEEYKDHQGVKRTSTSTRTRNGPVRRFTAQEWDILDREYKNDPVSNDGRNATIADRIGCEKRQVAVWWSNRNHDRGTIRPKESVGSKVHSGHESSTNAGNLERKASSATKVGGSKVGGFRFDAQQWDVLDREHQKNPLMTGNRHVQIAKTINCTPRQALTWFKRRNEPGGQRCRIRPREKRPAMMHDEDFSDYDDGHLAKRNKTSTQAFAGSLPADELNVDTQGYSLADIVAASAFRPASMAAKLSENQSKRVLDWNPRTQRNIKWNFNLTAALGYVIGEVSDEPCVHCSKGLGAFATCVRVPGFFYDSCAGCQYNNMFKRCSFYNPEKANSWEFTPSSNKTQSIPVDIPSPSLEDAQGKQQQTIRISPEHEDVLWLQRQEDPNPSEARICILSDLMGLSVMQVTEWFYENDRARRGSLSMQKEKEALDRLANTNTTLASFINADIKSEAKLSNIPYPTGQSDSSHTPPVVQNHASGEGHNMKQDANNIQLDPPKVIPRSKRYLKALAAVELMEVGEKRLEMADLKFRSSVLGNVVDNIEPLSRSARYRKQEEEMKEMSPEEQQLELHDLKFQMSVIQDAMAGER